MSHKTLKSPLSLIKPQAFSPPLRGEKRISFLLSNCSAFQESLIDTAKLIFKVSSEGTQLINSLTKAANDERPNELLQKELNIRKKKIQIEKEKKLYQIRKKIESIIKLPALPNSPTVQKVNSNKEFVNYDDISSKESKALLRDNRRKFGELFSDRKLTIEGRKSILGKLEDGKKRKIDVGEGTKNGGDEVEKSWAGSVREMPLPSFRKKNIRDEDREMLFSILKEQKNAAERLTVQKLMERRYFSP
jgi:hypothetical protein